VFLLRRRGLPLRRTWIEQPYGEEEMTPPDEAQATTKFSSQIHVIVGDVHHLVAWPKPPA
jgi:hypothetical protein